MDLPAEDCGGDVDYWSCVEFRKTGDEGTMGPWLGKWQPEDFDLTKMKAKFDK